MLYRRLVSWTAIMALALVASTAGATGISNGVVKIGVLSDLSGPYSADFSGPGTVAAVKMAVHDFGGKVLGAPIEVIVADDRDNPAVASAKAREWIDRDHVDLIADIADSAAALAVQKLASSKHVITMATSAGSSALTDADCTKYGIHYGYDTYALPKVAASSIAKEKDGKTWYFITVNYTFGHTLQQNATDIIEGLGGKVLGSSSYPFGTNDYSSYLLQAKNSGAQVVALANAGSDTVNSIKQAHEFGITRGGQKLVALSADVQILKSVGLKEAQGLEFTSAWYWDHGKASRAWTKRYLKYSDGAAPTSFHAAAYSAVMAYLDAVKAAGTDGANAVRAQLGKMKIDDFFAKGGYIRADGVLVHDMYLLKAKKPDQSHGTWDLARVVHTVPGNEAFMPPSDSQCPLLKH